MNYVYLFPRCFLIPILYSKNSSLKIKSLNAHLKYSAYIGVKSKANNYITAATVTHHHLVRYILCTLVKDFTGLTFPFK